ncbi:MAG: hypothetical protein K8W52_31250, partial [Deltaproteobacteria bacterium]|nr:hypothetical protein [Deltaproteobacteria bacterium]
PVPVAIGAVAIAAAAVLLATRGGAPVADPPAAAPVYTSRTLYPVPMRPAIALSPDGARVAVASADRLVVRGFGGGLWQFDHLAGDAVGHVEFADADHLRIALATAQTIITWTLSTDAIGERQPIPAGWIWQGTLADGMLLLRVVPDGFELAVATGGAAPRVVARAPGRLEVLAIAPDRKRVAFVEPSPTTGRVVVIDVGTGARLRGEPIIELSGLAWRDDTHLWLTTGTTTRPAIHEVAITGDQLGAPVVRYSQERGWFGQIASVPGRTVFVDSTNSFRAKLVTAAGIVQDLDPELVGAGFGWLDDGRRLGWNRASGALVPDDDRPAERIPVAIDGEPGNATRADDIAIVAMRKPGGREVVAVSLTTRQRAWAAPVGALAFVRCAGDRRPPCVASVPREGGARLVWIDPRTGALGDELAHAPEFLDAAVSPDGRELLLCEGGPRLRVIEVATGAERPVTMPMSNTRGVAYDERGGFLVAGTRAPVTYQILRVEGEKTSVLVQSDNEILFLPRPARDGHATLVMGRLFMPALQELVIR